MALLLTYKKSEIFDIVANKTLLLSRAIKNEDILLTDEYENIVRPFYCEAGRRVLEKVGAHTETINIPYIITNEGENFPEADSINFTIVGHDDSRDGVIVPLMESSVKEFIVSYTLNEWLKYNGVPSIEDVNDKLQQIKRNAEYGNRSQRKYRML